MYSFSTFNLYIFISFIMSSQQIIAEAEKMLDTIDGVTSVHGRFYELASSYHKLMGNHADYYRDALRFLGCTELSDIPSELLLSSCNCCICLYPLNHTSGLTPSFTLTFDLGAEQDERAFNLGLAAILGKGVYNFGELVSEIYPPLF